MERTTPKPKQSWPWKCGYCRQQCKAAAVYCQQCSTPSRLRSPRAGQPKGGPKGGKGGGKPGGKPGDKPGGKTPGQPYATGDRGRDHGLRAYSTFSILASAGPSGANNSGAETGTSGGFGKQCGTQNVWRRLSPLPQGCGGLTTCLERVHPINGVDEPTSGGQIAAQHCFAANQSPTGASALGCGGRSLSAGLAFLRRGPHYTLAEAIGGETTDTGTAACATPARPGRSSWRRPQRPWLP